MQVVKGAVNVLVVRHPTSKKKITYVFFSSYSFDAEKTCEIALESGCSEVKSGRVEPQCTLLVLIDFCPV